MYKLILDVEGWLLRFLEKKRTLLNRFFVSISLGFICLLTLAYVKANYEFYLSSLVIVSASLITIYGELLLGLFFTLLLGLISDYFFAAPIGTVLDSPEAILRFTFLVSNQLFLCLMLALHRSALKRVRLAKQEVQHSSQYARSLIEASLDPLVTILLTPYIYQTL